MSKESPQAKADRIALYELDEVLRKDAVRRKLLVENARDLILSIMESLISKFRVSGPIEKR